MPPSQEDTIMTLAERLRQEGWLEGWLEGSQDEAQKKFNRLLTQRFGEIRDPHIQERLRNATPNQIDRWFDRALEAKTIDEVIDE